LAEDVLAPAGLPAAACALRDGFAVSAEATADASAYTPVTLSAQSRVEVGDVLPEGTDAVAPLDAVTFRDGRYAALLPVAAGEGVLNSDDDVRAGVILRRAGQRLRDVDRTVIAIAGVERVCVREPRIRLVQALTRSDGVIAPVRGLIARAITAAGGMVEESSAAVPHAESLSAALSDASADAVIALGGTGGGHSDASVHTLARLGGVDIHGIALSPGETAALGRVGARPVLLIPGRVDAALAVWLVIGQPLLARLSGLREEQPTSAATLTRKVASSLGMTEVIPVRVHDGAADPLASGYWPLAAIAAADGWILVPPDSEGYPALGNVVVRAWP
jgi:molybdopterin biosynthesis enzyme